MSNDLKSKVARVALGLAFGVALAVFSGTGVGPAHAQDRTSLAAGSEAKSAHGLLGGCSRINRR